MTYSIESVFEIIKFQVCLSKPSRFQQENSLEMRRGCAMNYSTQKLMQKNSTLEKFVGRLVALGDI